ncbi:unnamed protein product [Cylicocyclus nassatus]|uniref:ShKT domain-containing protein n=1 Tax=Cylicocyclus nassatus TaxID=53992 RepID=A0AA36DJU6_CYLNA|nr:unnamed protein product [Cylicocyclus nassatus]
MHPLTLKTGGCVALKFLCEVEMFSVTVIEYCRRTCNKCDETTPKPEEPNLSDEIDDDEEDEKPSSSGDQKQNNKNNKAPTSGDKNGPGGNAAGPGSNAGNPQGGNGPPGNGGQQPNSGNGQNTGINQPSSNNCVDLVNPTTGVSDCPSRAHLCKNPLYKQLMESQCPKTCGKCPPSAPSLVCRDMINKVTGVSDCPNRAQLCRNPLYSSLMRQQCPFTCGYCV